MNLFHLDPEVKKKKLKLEFKTPEGFDVREKTLVGF
jgi:hypothetical protein